MVRRVALAEAADAADVGHALFEGVEAAARGAFGVVGAPRIVLRHCARAGAHAGRGQGGEQAEREEKAFWRGETILHDQSPGLHRLSDANAASAALFA